MKLLLITAIAAFEKDIKGMLKKAQVKTYTYKEVIGFKDTSEDSIESNWFATGINETESILFYAFVQEENVDTLFEEVRVFNDKQETLTRIHVTVLQIEKSN
ncbi:MAG: hypothetical protein ABI554_09140 [Flavobacterium sp.]